MPDTRPQVKWIDPKTVSREQRLICAVHGHRYCNESDADYGTCIYDASTIYPHKDVNDDHCTNCGIVKDD